MAENFYTLLTDIGKTKIANATAFGDKVNLSILKVGDSNGNYYDPMETQKDLLHTVWQGNITAIRTDSKNPNQIIAEAVIPSYAGGFTIRETGLFDDTGVMIAVAKYPLTYKPSVEEGSGKDITIRMILEVSNSASVTVNIDPAVSIATQKDIEELKDQINNINTPTNASDIGAVALTQIGVTGGVARQDDLISLDGKVESYKDSLGNKIIESENNSKAYADQQIQLVSATGIPKLGVYPFSISATVEGQNAFEIPYDIFDKTTDSNAIIAFLRTRQLPNDEFTVVQNEGERAKIVLDNGNGIEIGNKITGCFLKNVIIGPDGAVNGMSIAVNSLPQDRVIGLVDILAEFATLQNKVDNLSANDATARNEIMDIKLKLKEQTAINFLSKTGVGFYDTFEDNSNIDLSNTTATYDSINKNINFPYSTYTVKTTSAYNNVNLINVDTLPTIGDKIDNINAITNVNSVNNSVTYDRTTPISVVNSSFVTSATARPQVLSNGWVVTYTYDATNKKLYFYVDKNDGNGSNQLCYSTRLTGTSFAMCSYGTKIYVIGTWGSNQQIQGHIFDAASINNIDLGSYFVLDGSQTTIGTGCSISVSSTGVLTAAWCSKNSNYANSFNIRSAKSIDGGVTWTKQDGTAGVDQITTYNTSGGDYTNPYIIYDKNSLPVIVYQFYSTAVGSIYACHFNGASWASSGTIYNSASYAQSNPVATLQKYGTNAGRIWVVWCGLDSTDTTIYNIRVSYSDDGGFTWSTMQKLTSGNTYNQAYPTITSDLNGYIYILWRGIDSLIATNTFNTRQIIWNGSTWGTIVSLTTFTGGNSIQNPSTCDNYYNFTNPITIWQDVANTRVAFYGKWTVGGITYDVTLQNSITVTSGQTLNIYPSQKILKMINETFDTFNNLELNLYPNKINKATIKGAVNNSTTVITGNTDKVLTAGDKLFMDGVLNQVLSATGNLVTYDRTTPGTVVNSAYTTSSTARPQILSNGWIVTAELYSTTNAIMFNISKDNGVTWNSLCWTSAAFASGSFSIACYGTIVYLIANGTTDVTKVYYYKFDVTTVINNGIAYTSTIDSSQTSFGTGCSISVSSTGILTATWCSKNSNYANSFNIRSAKSIDGGITWTKQDGTTGVDQVTSWNSTGLDCSTPYVQYDKNGLPIILFARHTTSSNYNDCIFSATYTNSTWTLNYAYIASNITTSSYIQSNPVATLQKYGTNAGRICVTWYGYDSTDTARPNIRFSYSDDNGVTWSSMQKLTNGNTLTQQYPSITSDINGNVYITWSGYNTNYPTIFNIRQIVWNGTIWGSITEITNQNINTITNPSCCDNYYNFTNPITIWQDAANTRVAFYGKWTIGQGYTLTMQNPVTLTDGQQVPIIDFSVQQDNVNLVLNDIDSEKFIFKGDNLNTATASIKVTGKDNKLNSLVYAVA